VVHWFAQRLLISPDANNDSSKLRIITKGTQLSSNTATLVRPSTTQDTAV
jgi:hypothetical protein